MKRGPVFISFPLLFLWPVGGFVASLFKIDSKLSAFVYIIFCGLFGCAFSFNDTSADSFRIAYLFDRFNYTSINEIVNSFSEGGITDLYRFLMYGITKIFSNSPKILFGLFGIVFGVFSYLSLRLIVREKEGKNNIYFFILLAAFFALNPISNINGVRFWTASGLFFYSTFNFLFYNKKIWILGLICAPLIHFSFLLAVIVVSIFSVLNKVMYSETRINSVLFFIFILTFLASWILGTNSINIGFLAQTSLLSESVGNKVELYNSDKLTETVSERNSAFHIVSQLFANIIKVYLFIFILIVRNKLKNYPSLELSRLLAFIMFFLSVSFLASTIPSGARFIMIGYLFVMVLFVRYYKLFPTIFIKRYILLAIPVFSFQFFFTGFLSFLILEKYFWIANMFWILIDGFSFQKLFIL